MSTQEKTKHTPGPWRFEAPCIIGVIEGQEVDVCEMLDDGKDYAEFTQADAHLIAAAPELLEALELVYAGAMEDSGFAQSTTAIKARAAIAKARGDA